MEDSYRNNIVEFALIYLDKNFTDDIDFQEFDAPNFTNYIYKQLLNIDINQNGYGLDNSTKQMTNDIGDLKIYNEDDPKKINYIDEIKKGDLIFFHNQSLDDNKPSPGNRYPGHVGIYLGDKNFIHASPSEQKITINNLTGKWLDILIASRDIIKSII
ncbi:MAG: C40 family peptidase [Bacilli bacterium]|nr:C40 family peptidase [Bacilli bacterium]